MSTKQPRMGDSFVMKRDAPAAADVADGRQRDEKYNKIAVGMTLHDTSGILYAVSRWTGHAVRAAQAHADACAHTTALSSNLAISLHAPPPPLKTINPINPTTAPAIYRILYCCVPLHSPFFPLK